MISVLSASVRTFRNCGFSFVLEGQSIKCNFRTNIHILSSHLELTVPTLDISLPSQQTEFP